MGEQIAVDAGNRYERILDYYLTALSVAMLALGLSQWAVILGVIDTSGGPFETISTEWKIVVMHVAVVDLVAAVGLWMRTPWGVVVWIYAAVSEIVFHTVFVRKFGISLPLLTFHFLTLLVFVVLTILARRHAPRQS
jgi:hypothetical protein